MVQVWLPLVRLEYVFAFQICYYELCLKKTDEGEVVCIRQTQDSFSRMHFSHSNNFKKVHTQTPHIFLCTPKHPHNTFWY